MATNGTTPRARGDRDAPHASPVTPAEDARTILINRISWGAVMAGVAVALVAQLLLNMLGIGIGAATLDPTSGDNPAGSTLSIGAALWWTISGIIAAFIGGHAAGRLSGRPKGSTTAWHGLIAWALTTLVVIFLLTSAIGSIIGGALSTFGSIAGGLGKTAVQTAAPAMAQAEDPFGAIERQLRQASGGNDPAALRDAAVTAMRAALTGNEAEAKEARERAAQALARAQKIDVEQARAQVGQYEQQYRKSLEEAKQKATQAAATASSAASRGALFGFVAVVLGAVAGWFGGRSGAVEPTMTSVGATVRTSSP